MKTLNIQFNHPVQGRVQLRKKTEKLVKTFKFKSDRDFGVHISAQNLEDGDWSVSLEWNYDNQPFLIQKHFRILDNKIDLPSS